MMTEKLRKPRWMALDIGTVRCGVAISDELGKMAITYPYEDARERKVLIERIIAIAQHHAVHRVIVGLPLDLSGRETDSTRLARQFAEALASACTLEIVFWDERLTSKVAQQRLHQAGLSVRDSRQVIDSETAALLLQEYLDARQIAQKKRKEAKAQSKRTSQG